MPSIYYIKSMLHHITLPFTLQAFSRLGGVFRLLVWNCFLLLAVFFAFGTTLLQQVQATSNFATVLDNKPSGYDDYDCHIKVRGQFAQYQGISGVFDWYIYFDNPTNQNRIFRTGTAKDGSAVITLNTGSSSYTRYYWYNNQWTPYTGSYATALDPSVYLQGVEQNILSDCNLYGYSTYTYTGGFHQVGNPFYITTANLIFLANSNFQSIPTIDGLVYQHKVIQQLNNGEIEIQEILTTSQDLWILIDYPIIGNLQGYTFLSKYPTKYLQINRATGLPDELVGYSETDTILDVTILGLWNLDDPCLYINSPTSDIYLYDQDFRFVKYCPISAVPFPEYDPDFPIYQAPVDDWGTFNFLKEPLESLSDSLSRIGEAIVIGVIEAIKFIFNDLFFNFDTVPKLFADFFQLFVDKFKAIINPDVFTTIYNANPATLTPITTNLHGQSVKVVDFQLLTLMLPYVQPILITAVVLLVSRVNFMMFKRYNI